MKDDDNLFVVQVLGWWVVQGEQPGPAGHQGGHTQSASQAAQPITHQLLNVSRDFWASEFETICVPDKQAKILSNSVSISPIIKFGKSDSAVCMTPRSKHLGFVNPYFFPKIYSTWWKSSSMKGLFLIFPLKSIQRSSKFSLLIPRCHAYRGVRLCNVHDTAQSGFSNA